MKKRISFLLAVIMIVAVMIPAIPVSATEPENKWDPVNEVYEIATKQDFLNFVKSCSLDVRYETAAVDKGQFDTVRTVEVKLVNNIVLNDTSDPEWYKDPNVTKMPNALHWFTSGTFNGNGYKIEGYYNDIQSPDFWAGSVGFIGSAEGYTIKNLTLAGFYIKGAANNQAAVGALVGYVPNGKGVNIENCRLANGIIDGNNVAYAGAVIGYTYTGDNGVADSSGVGHWNINIDCDVDNTVKVVNGLDGANGGIVGFCSIIGESSGGNVRKMDYNLSGSNFAANGETGVLQPIGKYSYTGLPLRIYTGVDGNDGFKEIETPTAEELSKYNSVFTYTTHNQQFVGFQEKTNDATAIRLVGLVTDYENITELGFKITVGGVTKECKVTKVYSSIEVKGVDTPAPTGTYYFTYVITGIPAGTQMTVATYEIAGGQTNINAASTYTMPAAAN